MGDGSGTASFGPGRRLLRAAPAAGNWTRRRAKRPTVPAAPFALASAGFALLLVMVSLPNHRFLAYFSREHFALRCCATPTYALDSLRKHARAGWGVGRRSRPGKGSRR